MMKKKILICLSILLVVIGVAAILLLPQTSPFEKKEHVYIAVAGPMRTTAGKAMLKGIRLCLEKREKEGKLKNKKVELLIFNDKNDRRAAVNVASDITDENKALLVLGHYYSSTSIVAGEIYKKNGMPAITASGTDISVTLANDWYFRVVPNNRFQASFIANYLNKDLKEPAASIIVKKGSYGSFLSESFEEAARKIGMEIKKKWEIDKHSKTFDDDLKKIINELRSVDDPGALFFATHGDEAVKIITSIKYPGTKYTIMGPDAFANKSFKELFQRYPQEQSVPGYYSDGIYAVSPFMADTANEKAYAFRQEFIKKYDEEPSWVAACYYDAMSVTLEAIEKAEIEGDEKHIRGDRKKIREFLTSLYSYELAIEGVSGRIYFDRHGDVDRPLSVGIYEKQRFIPAFSQYQLISGTRHIEDTFKKALHGNIITIGENVMMKTRIVYAGIDINEVSKLDMKESTYTIDFYIWFRFHRMFDDTDIQFLNSVYPIRLGTPILEETVNDVTTRAYHLKADFKTDFDFHEYPFDEHRLRIRFRHALQRDKLIFVPDSQGLPQSADPGKLRKTRFDSVSGWNINKISCYQNIITNISTLGSPKFFDLQNAINYSQFNAVIQIERRDWRFILKNFFPVIIMILILYLKCFLPYEYFSVRVPMSMAVLITNAIYHLKILEELEVKYLIVIEYAFFSVYVLVLLSALTSISVYILRKRGAGRKIKFLINAERIIHPCAVLAVGFLFVYTYYK